MSKNFVVDSAWDFPYFLNIQRKGDSILVMSFAKTTGIEEVWDEYNKRKASFDADYRVWEARPAVGDNGLPKSPPPIFAFAEPPVKPVTSDVAKLYLDPDTAIAQPLGAFFNGADIGAPEGIWAVVEWDIYHHNSSEYGMQERRGRQHWAITIDSKGYIYAPFNRLKEAEPFKDKNNSDLRRLERSTVLSVVVPFEDSKLDECPKLICYNKAVGMATNIPNLTPKKPEELTGHLTDEFIPQLIVAGIDKIDPDQLMMLTVTATINKQPLPQGKFMKVYMEATAGYLPVREFVIGSDPVEIPFRTIDVPKGTEIQIKARFDNDYAEYGPKITTVTVI